LVELLREGRAFPQHGTLPVDDVDGDDEQEGDAEEDRVGVFEVMWGPDVCRIKSVDILHAMQRYWMGRKLTFEEGGSWEGEDTGEEIARPAVAACG
jgi:hypothetical protein